MVRWLCCPAAKHYVLGTQTRVPEVLYVTVGHAFNQPSLQLFKTPASMMVHCVGQMGTATKMSGTGCSYWSIRLKLC